MIPLYTLLHTAAGRAARHHGARYRYFVERAIPAVNEAICQLLDEMHTQPTDMPVLEQRLDIGSHQRCGVKSTPFVAQGGAQGTGGLEDKMYIDGSALAGIAMGGNVGEQFIQHEPEGRRQRHGSTMLLRPVLHALEERREFRDGTGQGAVQFSRRVHRQHALGRAVDIDAHHRSLGLRTRRRIVA